MVAAKGEGDRDQDSGSFDPEVLDRTVLAIPLLNQLKQERADRIGGRLSAPVLYSVVVEINLEHVGERPATYDVAAGLIRDAIETKGQAEGQGIVEDKSVQSKQYLFARLDGEVIQEVVARNESLLPSDRPIFRIWPDFPIGRL
ncbi:MAG: hypothetical protein ACLP01_24215 [Solirubrobacteraceae bacterium]